MTTKMRDTAKMTVVLTVYALHKHGIYIKEVLTFESNYHREVEIPICAYETPEGRVEMTTEDVHFPTENPDPPHPDDEPRPVSTHGFADIITARVGRLDLPALVPTLPDNPTAEERWRYLLDMLKQQSES